VDRTTRPAEDSPGFEELYERVAPSLYAWAAIRLARGAGGLDPEDVLQEVWLRARRRYASFDPARTDFRTWTIGIAKHVLLEDYRRRARSGVSAAPRPAVEDCPESVTSIGTRLARDEALQRFLARVGELEPEDRMLLLHCGFEGYTTAAAATRLGIAAEAAKKRWQRLRARLGERSDMFALLVEPG
jgi:RNA polymerase sigma-70 factor (ECF subfamily)